MPCHFHYSHFIVTIFVYHDKTLKFTNNERHQKVCWDSFGHLILIISLFCIINMRAQRGHAHLPIVQALRLPEPTKKPNLRAVTCVEEERKKEERIMPSLVATTSALARTPWLPLQLWEHRQTALLIVQPAGVLKIQEQNRSQKQCHLPPSEYSCTLIISCLKFVFTLFTMWKIQFKA